MKITEKARVPGTCFICAQPIHVGDVIVCSHLGTNPVAAHAQCDPEFSTGGAAPPEKIALRSGNVKRHSLERLASFVDAVVGKRLTYARLIAAVQA